MVRIGPHDWNRRGTQHADPSLREQSMTQRAERVTRATACHVCKEPMAAGEIGVRSYQHWCHLRCHGERSDAAIAEEDWAKREDAKKEAHVKGPRGHLPVD